MIIVNQVTKRVMIILGVQMATRNTSTGAGNSEPKRGMVLPFEPLSLSFNQVNYYVDMPAVRLSLTTSLLSRNI